MVSYYNRNTKNFSKTKKNENYIKVSKKERLSIEEKEKRINDLRSFLFNSDFKVLPDYDQPNDEIKEQRKAWRKELRELQDEA